VTDAAVVERDPLLNKQPEAKYAMTAASGTM
jgi:hypothetical protein